MAVLMLGDVAAINIGLLFSYWLRFSSGIFPIVYGIPHVSHYFKILPVLTLVMLFLMRSDKLYSVRARLSIVDEFFMIIRSHLIPKSYKRGGENRVGDKKQVAAYQEKPEVKHFSISNPDTPHQRENQA